MTLLRTTRGGKTVDFALVNGGILLGTAPGCQIVVADPAAAPKHCKIVRAPQGFVVTDLSGGTVVNGTKVKEHVLRAGDVLQIGSEKFVFAEKTPESAAVAARAPAPKRTAVPAPAPQSAAPKAAAPPAGGRRPLPARGGAPGPRKLTVKPGSVARVHKSHSMFVLPSTPKGKAIAVSVALGLVVLGGVLFALSANTVDSEEVKKAAEADIKRGQATTETDFQARYKLVEEILANEAYHSYALGVIQPAMRVKDDLKNKVDLENRAERPVKQFFEKLQALKAGPHDEFKREWEALYDTVKVLLSNFEGTKYAAELNSVRLELKQLLETVGPTWNEELPKLAREVQRLIVAGNFTAGLAEVDKFGTTFKEKESKQLAAVCKELRDKLADSAKAHVERIRSTNGRTTNEEKRKALEAARPNVQGFPDVVKLVDKYISELQ